MSGKLPILRYCLLSLPLAFTLTTAKSHAQQIPVPFGPDRWDMSNAQAVNRFGFLLLGPIRRLSIPSMGA